MSKMNYIKKYRIENYRQFIVCVNRKTEEELLKYLEGKPSFTKYVKDLIRKDMEK